MKKVYMAPEMEICKIESENLICASGGISGDGDVKIPGVDTGTSSEEFPGVEIKLENMLFDDDIQNILW